MVQEEPNMYLSNMSSSSEGILGRQEESETSRRSTTGISTRCQNIRRDFQKHIQIFLVEGGSCSYEYETIGDIEVPLRHKHIVKQWVPKDIPQLNTGFCVNERIYRIAPLSLHGLGFFCMDSIMVGYDIFIELMEYVGPYYNYID